MALALAFTLFFAELADAAKLAPIIGAFVAGLSLSRSELRERIERDLTPVGHLFIPVFFLAIGINVDINAFARVEVLEIAAALTVVAVIGKLLAAVGAFGSPGDKPLIGLGMLPRGEVGLIFATIGLKEGVLGENLYASLLLVVLVTTLIAPPLLRWRLQRMEADRRPALGSAEPVPAGGWLRVDGTVELAGDPPTRVAVGIGLQAALAIAEGGVPGPRLLDWLGALPNEPAPGTGTRPGSSSRCCCTATTDRGASSRRAACSSARSPSSRGPCADAVPIRICSTPARSCASSWSRASATSPATMRGPGSSSASSSTPSGCCSPRSSSTPPERTPSRWRSPAASPTASTSVRQPSRRSRCSSGNPGLLRATVGRVEGLRRGVGAQARDPRGDAGAGPRAVPDEPRARAARGRGTAAGSYELLELIVRLLEQPGVTGLEVRNLVEQRRAEATRLVAKTVTA